MAELNSDKSIAHLGDDEIVARVSVLRANLGTTLVAAKIDGTVVALGGPTEVLFGWTTDDVIGQNLSEIFLRPNAWRQCIDDAELRLSHDVEVRHKSGEILRAKVAVSKLDEDGPEFDVLLTFQDLAGEHQQTIGIVHEPDLYSLAFNNAPIPMAVTAIDDRLMQVNDAWCTMLGYSPMDMVRRSISDLTHPDDREEAEKRRRDIVATSMSGSSQIEKRFVHKSGKVVWALVHASLVKGDSLTETYLITQAIDISDRKESEARLRQLALTDPLTGTANRVLFTDRLEQARGRHARTGGALAVLYLDVDHFKPINDRLGHAGGDELLNIIADRLREVLRPADTLSRVGGDEFVILCEDLPDVGFATGIARRILEVIEAPAEIMGETCLVSASIGVLTVTGDQMHRYSVVDLLRDADTAMYRAKSKGRARYELFTDALHEQMRKRLELEEEIRIGLAENQFVLYYQPVLDLEFDRVDGFEALIRWNHPERGIVMPAEFLQIMEESGMVADLGVQNLWNATKQIAEWRKKFGLDLKIGINVSGAELGRGPYHQDLAEVFEAVEIPADRVILEITENVLIEPGRAESRDLLACADLGVQLSIDDFGTGWSSLAYLQRFPVSSIKIDRSFVAAIEDGSEAITSTLVHLARSMDITVVAEGIETPYQLRRLRELGCPLGQGYYLARPLCVEDAEKFLEEAVKNQLG